MIFVIIGFTILGAIVLWGMGSVLWALWQEAPLEGAIVTATFVGVALIAIGVWQSVGSSL